MSDYSVTLSTTEPNNYVGLIKLRQGDVASQSIKATITANGQLFNFDRLSVFFNAVLPNGNVVRDKVTNVDYVNSKLNYVVANSFLQEVAQVTAWFSFENGYKIIDSTKNFQYSVIGGWKECIPQGNYIYELSELQREIEEIISNKDFTSLISKISSLETRIDDLENETTAQFAQTVNKGEGGVITPAMLSQETKEQMIGGSVAVVGIDSVLTENIVDKQVTPEKTTFINNKLNFTLERGTILSGVNDNTISTRRVRSTSIVKHTDGIYIVRKNANYLIGAVTYENGIFDGIDRGWIDRDVIELQGKNELRINVRRRDDAAIADNELATIAAGIEIKHNFQSADAKDVERAVQDITAIKGSIAQTISLKSEEFEMGTINENIPLDHTKRARMKNMLRVSKGDIIKFQKDPTIVNYGISISDLNGVWRGVDYGWLNQPEFIIEEDSFIQLTVRYVDNRDLDANALKMLTENTFNITYSPRSIVDTIKKNMAIGSISVEYGRIKGASYVFARIPKTLNDGSRFVPKVALTSGDGSLSGAKRSALNYARDKDTIFTLNAGLFNVTTVEPVGQLIIDGVSLINTPMTSDNGVPIHPDECYPLAIDGNGNLTTYPRNADTADMIADGVKYAVTAWGKLVDNFQITTEDIDNEIVHNGKYIRQSIGQYQNGDYCVCSVDMTRGPVTNEAGLYYEELAQLFVDKGVKFAYSLDGGGSAETVISKRQLNPIYEGSAGRAVPTVITFEIVN